MSQSHNPTDTQGLLQSMLQRLKLQSGREGQPVLHSPEPVTAASTWKQDGESGASNLQKVNSSPVNGFQFGANGIPSKEFGISAAGGNFGLKQPGHGCEMDRGLLSFPSQKDNIDNGTGENRVSGQATSPGITPTGTGQLFPTKSLKDADITSFERTDGERMSFGTRHMPGNKDAVTSLGQNQGFTPKVYLWSLKPTDANLDTGSQENEPLHVGNGGFGGLAQSKDTQFVTGSPKTTNSSLRRKQRSSENKTRRWTQKIKERWMDRAGGFGKKGKDEGGGVEQKSEQGTEISPQKQLPTAGNQEKEKTLLSIDSSGPGETHTDGSAPDGRTRSSSDFDFGLGSFSLLEEIVTGQEWAKFLNPNLPATSANQRPPDEPLTVPPNTYDSGRPSLNRGGGYNPWSFRGTESSPVSHFSMAQVPPDAFLSVSMDVTEGKRQQYLLRVAEQSEPMEDGHNQSDALSVDRGRGQPCRPPSFVEPADTLDSSALKRVHLNRKRQHQSTERRDERLQTENISDGKEAGRGRSVSSPSHVMDETGDSHRDVVMPLDTLNSPTAPLSPSAFNPFAPAPRGVLKHSISQDSESWMETVTKRRRVEENRRVHFAEEVMTIVPPELDADATDSEEDSGAEEEGSVIGKECEVEPAAAMAMAMVEEVAPARRPALPAWIRALKRKNTARKNR